MLRGQLLGQAGQHEGPGGCSSPKRRLGFPSWSQDVAESKLSVVTSKGLLYAGDIFLQPLTCSWHRPASEVRIRTLLSFVPQWNTVGILVKTKSYKAWLLLVLQTAIF